MLAASAAGGMQHPHMWLHLQRPRQPSASMQPREDREKLSTIIHSKLHILGKKK